MESRERDNIIRAYRREKTAQKASESIRALKSNKISQKDTESNKVLRSSKILEKDNKLEKNDTEVVRFNSVGDVEVNIEQEFDEDFDRTLGDNPHFNHENIDIEIDRIIAEMTENNIKKSNYAYWKSVMFKISDESIKIILIGIGVTIGILGVSSYENSNITAVLGFVVAGLIELREKFNLGPRSVVFRNCYHLFEQANSKLLKLRYSGIAPLEIMDKLYDIELQLNKIDLSSFNSDVINIHSYSIFNNKDSLKVVKPADIIREDDTVSLH